MSETSGTSPGIVPALPERWAEKIFRRLENFYGAKWHDSLGGIPRERVKQAWGEELADYTPEQIARGLNGCRGRVWPPTLPEFLLLCRPVADAKVEWAEAREQMSVRMRGQGGDAWSRSQVYWAAVAIGGFDLQTQGWELIRARWEYALASAKFAPVPEFIAPQPALPAPGAQCITREEVRRRIPEVSQRIVLKKGGSEPSLEWAAVLMQREAAGESLQLVSRRIWREVLRFSPDAVAADAARQWSEARAQ